MKAQKWQDQQKLYMCLMDQSGSAILTIKIPA